MTVNPKTRTKAAADRNKFKQKAARKSTQSKRSGIPDVRRAPRKIAAAEAPRYANIDDLLPGEPYFLLKGRDPLGEMFVMSWCMFRRYQIQMGLVPDTAEERAQIAEGFRNATEMQIFARDYAVKREHALTKFDDNGNAIERDGVNIPRGRKGS